MNSKPTPIIKNACAGIISTDTFSVPVRILETEGTPGCMDHLELVFGTDDVSEAANRHLKPNKAYG
jgi:hypothetical protein